MVVATLGLACCANCQGTSGQQPPQEPAVGAGPAPAAAHGGAPAATQQQPMTEQELQQCIADCGQSQQDHPEETPYDCRETCLQGQIVQ